MVKKTTNKKKLRRQARAVMKTTRIIQKTYVMGYAVLLATHL